MACEHETDFALQRKINEDNARLTKKLVTWAFGNGRRGADTRLDDLESNWALVKRMVWLLLASVVGNVVTLGFFLIKEVLTG